MGSHASPYDDPVIRALHVRDALPVESRLGFGVLTNPCSGVISKDTSVKGLSLGRGALEPIEVQEQNRLVHTMRTIGPPKALT
jgi:hypothetical protein